MEAILKQGLESLGLDAAAIPTLTEFTRRLLEKNKVMNLTAITEPRDVATLHLLDCAYLLTAADFRGQAVVDVGTGAGFPGMPMAILEPTARLTCWTAWESVRFPAGNSGSPKAGKRFLHPRPGGGIRLPTIGSPVRLRRVPGSGGAAGAERAGAGAGEARRSVPAMKSVDSDAEIDSARSAIGQLGGKIEKLLDYTVPCTEVRHRVVLIRKVKPTPRQFPRAFARIKKSPLK